MKYDRPATLSPGGREPEALPSLATFPASFLRRRNPSPKAGFYLRSAAKNPCFSPGLAASFQECQQCPARSGRHNPCTSPLGHGGNEKRLRVLTVVPEIAEGWRFACESCDDPPAKIRRYPAKIDLTTFNPWAHPPPATTGCGARSAGPAGGRAPGRNDLLLRRGGLQRPGRRRNGPEVFDPTSMCRGCDESQPPTGANFRGLGK